MQSALKSSAFAPASGLPSCKLKESLPYPSRFGHGAHHAIESKLRCCLLLWGFLFCFETGAWYPAQAGCQLMCPIF